MAICSEFYDLYDSVLGHNVLWVNVTVCSVLTVDVLNTFANLSEDLYCLFLLIEVFGISKVTQSFGMEVSIFIEFHDNIKVSLLIS